MSTDKITCHGSSGNYKPHPLGTSDSCLNCADWNTNYDPQTIELTQAMREQVLLDPKDPFEAVIIDMVNMNRKKRRDYALDGDPFSNFGDTAGNLGMEGFGPTESAYVLLLTKISRLRSLRKNGRMLDPSNESVLDTYLDLAVYAAIVLALVKGQQ